MSFFTSTPCIQQPGRISTKSNCSLSWKISRVITLNATAPVALRRQGYEVSTEDSLKPRKYIHLGALQSPDTQNHLAGAVITLPLEPLILLLVDVTV